MRSSIILNAKLLNSESMMACRWRLLPTRFGRSFLLGDYLFGIVRVAAGWPLPCRSEPITNLVSLTGVNLSGVSAAFHVR